MAQPVRKWRLALNMDQQKDYAKANPKSISKSEQYGTSQWVDVAEWEDGGLTLTGYDPETKTRFKIGNTIKQQENAQQSAPAKVAVQDDGLPF